MYATGRTVHTIIKFSIFQYSSKLRHTSFAFEFFYSRSEFYEEGFTENGSRLYDVVKLHTMGLSSFNVITASREKKRWQFSGNISFLTAQSAFVISVVRAKKIRYRKLPSFLIIIYTYKYLQIFYFFLLFMNVVYISILFDYYNSL